MPADAAGTTDPIGAPPLCPFHAEVIRNLAEKDHVDDRESERAAHHISRQCCNRGRNLR